MSKRIHLCLDIRGAIMNESFAGFKNDDGSRANKQEVKAFLLDQLAMGRKVIPLGPCDNFDYQKGCLGHEEVQP